MIKKTFKLSEISNLLNGKLSGDGSKEIHSLKTLQEADTDSISFIYNKKFVKDLEKTSASAVIITEEFSKFCRTDYIVVSNGHVAYAKLTKLLSGNLRNNLPEESKLTSYDDQDIQIGKNVFIGEDVRIDNGVRINSGCFIGNNVEIKADSYLHPNVCIYHDTKIGKKNIIHANSVLGSDGLGFAKTKDSWEKIEHLGNVELKDNVEIGANSTIDRGSLGDTIINSFVMIDNLVHVAHNVIIGKGTIICGQSGIAGSTIIGDNVIIGAQVGIAGHLKIASGVILSARSGVTKDINNSEMMGGFPALPIQEFRRLCRIRRMAKIPKYQLSRPLLTIYH
mgnify:CR=1 FL=1